VTKQGRRYQAAIYVLVTLMLASCGGGGSGGGGSSPVSGNGPAPASGPGDAANYFPLAMNDSWTYDEVAPSTFAAQQPGYTVATVTGPAMVGAQSVTVLSAASTVSGSTIANYYASTGGGLTFYGNNDLADPVTSQIVPYAELLYPVQAETVSTIRANNISFGKASNGDPLQTSFTQTTAVASLETVTVTAGTFANAAKVVQMVSGTATDTVSGKSVPYSGTDTTWLAPGVGVVQDITVATVNGSTSTSTLTARGYSVGGVAHGLSKPFTLDPSSDSTQDFYIEDIAAATNLTTSLTLERGMASTSSGFNVTAVLADLAGNVLTKAVLGQGDMPALAFDGTNYEVVLQEAGNFSVFLISPAGQTVATYSIPNAAASNGNPIALASGATNLAFAFFGRTATQAPCVCALFLSPGGQPPSGALVQLASASYTTTPPTPGIGAAFDGTNFLVVWSTSTSTGSSIYAVRVSPSGTVLDATPLLISSASPSSTVPRVAFDGANYLVVWSDGRNAAGGTNRDIFGARVSPQGSLVDGPPATGGVRLSSAVAMARGTPGIAFNGKEYVIAWVAGGDGIKSAGYTIAGVRVTPPLAFPSGAGFELSIGAPFGGTPPTQNPLEFDYYNPIVATPAGGGAGVIAWRDVINPGTLSLKSVTVSPF
jgi:hypothetical protein